MRTSSIQEGLADPFAVVTRLHIKRGNFGSVALFRLAARVQSYHTVDPVRILRHDDMLRRVAQKLLGLGRCEFSQHEICEEPVYAFLKIGADPDLER